MGRSGCSGIVLLLAACGCSDSGSESGVGSGGATGGGAGAAGTGAASSGGNAGNGGSGATGTGATSAGGLGGGAGMSTGGLGGGAGTSTGGSGGTSSGGASGSGGTSSGGTSGSGGTSSGGTSGSGGTSSGGTSGSGGSPGAPFFFDDFEYVVSPTSSASNQATFQAAGWYTAKAINVTGSWGGNLYTATSITGENSSFPGQGSSRVLCINSLAGTLTTQADFYLQYGSGTVANTIPGNVWVQFWIYPNRHGAEQTGFHSREKFLYPCDGQYPCNTNKWLWMLASSSYEPHNAPISNGNAFIVERDNSIGTVNYSLAAPGDESKIGQTNVSEYIAANRWTLVKLHFDTSTTTGRYEAWLRPRGSAWVKVAEWIGGVTPNFTWNIPAGSVGGHRALRIPTTMPANATNGTQDAWVYLDDFAMATSEAALPTY
ncbi:MAG: hypothetical protein R3B13_34095 [Polyangiaceae bacterium]